MFQGVSSHPWGHDHFMDHFSDHHGFLTPHPTIGLECLTDLPHTWNSHRLPLSNCWTIPALSTPCQDCIWTDCRQVADYIRTVLNQVLLHHFRHRHHWCQQLGHISTSDENQHKSVPCCYQHHQHASETTPNAEEDQSFCPWGRSFNKYPNNTATTTITCKRCGHGYGQSWWQQQWWWYEHSA